MRAIWIVVTMQADTFVDERMKILYVLSFMCRGMAHVMITIDFGTHLVAIRWRRKGTQLFRQQCCRVIYTSKVCR